MHKTITTVLFGCIALASVQAQSSQRKVIATPEQLIPVHYAPHQNAELNSQGFSRTVAAPAVYRAPASNPGVAAVAPVALGTAGNVLGSILNDCNQVVADDSTGLVMFIHRNNQTIFGGSTGLLRYDVSIDGGATFSNDIGPLNPTMTIPARYPQIASYGAPGNTNPLSSYAVVIAPTITTTWDGHVNGFSQVTTSGAPVTTENYQFSGTASSIPVSLNERVTGEFWTIEAAYPGATLNGQFYVCKGVYNGSDIIWNRVDTISPNNNLSYDGTPHFTSPQISFSPDGQTGWISILADINGGPDSTLQPCFVKSTDGGQTWGTPTEYNLNSDAWVADTLQSLWVDTLGNPASTGRATAGFDADLTVDVNGNPHLAVVIGSGTSVTNPLPGYTISSGLAKFLGDVTTPDGGVTWTTKYISPILTFRTQVFGATATTVSMDNNVQIARNNSGEEIFFSWVDSDTAQFTGNMNGVGFGESINLAPNLRIAALRVADGFQTYPQLVSDMDLIWEGRILFPTMAPVVLGNGYEWNLPIVVAEMPAYEPVDPANFYYFGNDASICTYWFEDPATMNLGWPGILSHTNSPCFLEAQNTTAPKANMGEVFPNPATDKAEIRFTLPANGETRIEIVNMYGQVVDVIADETFAAGSHSRTINTAQFAEGVYLCNLYFGNEVITKKLVVSK